MVEIYIEMAQQLWQDLQQGLLPDFGGWNYMLMAVLIMIQGRASALLGGIAAATGYLNLGLIILVALLTRMLVDLFWYRVGATGLIDRISRLAAPFEEYAQNINDKIHEQPTRLVLISKTVGGLAVPVTIAMGNARVPLRRWLPASVIGELFWTLPLLLLGFFATDAVSNLRGGLIYLTAGSVVLMLTITLLKQAKSRFAVKDSQA
jgi:membrane protein DedA with SNARE-associated domain